MKTPKNPSFFCEKCQFLTSNKKDYKRHLLTLKHVNETNETNLKHENPCISLTCTCNEKFNSRTTLWRH